MQQSLTGLSDRPVHFALTVTVSLAIITHLAQKLLSRRRHRSEADGEAFHLRLLGDPRDDLDRVLDTLEDDRRASLTPAGTLVRWRLVTLLLALPLRIIAFKILTRRSQCLKAPFLLSSLVSSEDPIPLESTIYTQALTTSSSDPSPGLDSFSRLLQRLATPENTQRDSIRECFAVHSRRQLHACLQ